MQDLGYRVYQSAELLPILSPYNIYYGQIFADTCFISSITSLRMIRIFISPRDTAIGRKEVIRN